ncbi:hypothetical protein BJ878DRAFT_531434 [Calycina marina]|uniref:Uncharacterized protein n=1 Tax=Calycina marina TaxID=1763456 RepID=A0A9P7ZCU0_9HELO|nr:hypothetical protein BJ878DRAFT_531434 [Calycina marina]
MAASTDDKMLPLTSDTVSKDIVTWTFGGGNVDQNKPLYIDVDDPDRFLSANDCRRLVRQLCAGFRYHGLEQGDCVGVVSLNEIHYTSLFLGIIGAGGYFSGTNPTYKPDELAQHMRTSEVKFFLTSPYTLEKVMAAAKECGFPVERIFILNYNNEDIPDGCQSWRLLLEHGETDWVNVRDSDNTPAAYLPTSGTSGLPKSAIITHKYFISQAEYQLQISKSLPYEVKTLAAIAPFHGFMIPVQHTLPLRTGYQTYVMTRYSIEGFIAAIRKFRITHTAIVPPMMKTLAKYDTDELEPLRRIYVGGSDASSSGQLGLYKKLSADARIVNVYGMTEAGWAITTIDEGRPASGSVGYPLPGFDLRLIDEHQIQVDGEDMPGEIQIKAICPLKGYLNDPEATAAAFTKDGWLRTGDVGETKDGKMFVVGRIKDIIKVNGTQVSPTHVEQTLMLYKVVADAAVIGRDDDNYGELPVAFVVRSADVNGVNDDILRQSIKSWSVQKLGRHEQIKELDDIFFLDEIPKNPTGKILRRHLRDMLPDMMEKAAEEKRAEQWSAPGVSSLVSPDTADSMHVQ